MSKSQINLFTIFKMSTKSNFSLHFCDIQPHTILCLFDLENDYRINIGTNVVKQFDHTAQRVTIKGIINSIFFEIPQSFNIGNNVY